MSKSTVAISLFRSRSVLYYYCTNKLWCKGEIYSVLLIHNYFIIWQTLIISNLTTPSSLANTPIQTLNIPHSPSQMLSLTQPNTVTYTTQQQSPIISSSNELLAKALQQQQQQQQPYGLNQNDMDMLITNTNAASTSNLNKLLMGTNSRARNLSGGIVMSNPSFVSTLSSLIPPQQQSPTTILSQMSPSGKTPKGTNRRSSTGSSSSSAGAINSPPQMTANSQHSKREGEFLVPKVSPADKLPLL